MKQLCMLISFFCYSKISFAQQAAASNTYAIIIGVASYLDPEIPRLQYANRDAEKFAEFLRSKAGGSVAKKTYACLQIQQPQPVLCTMPFTG